MIKEVICINQRLMNLIQWGMAFDEINEQKNRKNKEKLEQLIQGAIKHDSFQMKLKNNLILLHPEGMPKAEIYIEFDTETYQIKTINLWREIELVYEKDREA